MIPLLQVLSAGAAPFSPASISGLDLWLKADTLTELVDGDPVTTWLDSSVAGNNATQANASYRPTYRTAVINGCPVVRFDGTDDRMASARSSSGAAQTVFAVVKFAGANQAILGGTDGVSSGGLNWYRNGNGKMEATNQDVALLGTATEVVTTTAFHVVALRWHDVGNAIIFRKDGVGDGGASPTVSISTGRATSIGRHSGNFAYLNGDVAEIVCYSVGLTDAQMLDVEGYLLSKYALA